MDISDRRNATGECLGGSKIIRSILFGNSADLVADALSLALWFSAVLRDVSGLVVRLVDTNEALRRVSSNSVLVIDFTASRSAVKSLLVDHVLCLRVLWLHALLLLDHLHLFLHGLLNLAHVRLYGHRLEADVLHVSAHLTRHFLEKLFSQVVSSNSLTILDKLHNITLGEVILVVFEQVFI